MNRSHSTTPPEADPIRTRPEAAAHVPDHELLRCIGGGSYGDVWLARNALGAYRAVKVVRRANFEHERPFEREFSGIQKFEPISRQHEGLVDLLQVGRNEAEGYFYYVMELADATDTAGEKVGKWESEKETATPTIDAQTYSPKTLRSLLSPAHFPTCPPASASARSPARTGRLPLDDCIALGLALTRALAYLHGQGLVHRDIKPSNIIFVGGEPKLADVGLVASVGEARSYVGTEGFIPPEGPGSPQADLYGLGILLYVMSTGKSHQDFPEPLPDLAAQPDHARWLEFNAVIHKACAADPRERYQSAEGMLAELELLRVGQSVRRTRGHQRLWSQAKKAALGLLLLALIAATIARMTRQTQRNEAAGDGPPSTNELANALVDKAMKLLGADDSIGSPEAYTNLLKAIELDPNFARAYIGLFDLRVDRFVPGLPTITAPELSSIVSKLAEVGPDLPSTHKAQSILALEELDFPSAERHALKAIEMNPSPRVVSFYCFMLVQWGRTKEAREWLEKARAFEASGGFAYRVMGHSYYVERDFTNAIAWYRKAITWEPRQAAAYNFIGSAYLAMRDFTNGFANKAIADILWGADEFKTKQKYDRYRDMWATRGERGYWEERLKQMKEDLNSDHVSMARVQIQIGETNAAIRSLEECYEKRERVGMESLLIYLIFDEWWDGLRGDRRFQELLDKIGFTKVMRNGKN